jgi:hypothetical protein
MVNLRFDFRDVFKAGRYAFSGKKMAVHFVGIAIWYVIYEIILYLSVLISGQVKEFWSWFGLRPVFPLSDFSRLTEDLQSITYDVQPITYVAMGIGLLVAFIIFFVTSTMVSKIALQQLRGDDFYSMRDSAGFARKQWKTIFGAFLGLIAILIFCIIWPVGIGLLGIIPAVGKVITMLSAFLLVPAFMLGLLMALVVVVFLVALFFVPSITACVEQDTFENIYQHFSIVWNQPWRIAVYELLLMAWKAFCVRVFALMSGVGFFLILLPIGLLISDQFYEIIWRANGWLGNIVEQRPDISFSAPEHLSALLAIAGMLMALTILFIIGFVLSYLASMASVGNTIIYVVLRKKISDENLLEVEEEKEEEEKITPTQPEEKAEEPAPEEKPAEAESQAERPEAEKSET